MDPAEAAWRAYAEQVKQQVEHPYFPLIHEYTRDKAIGAQELSILTGISIAHAYRLVKQFEKTGLLARGADTKSPLNRTIQTYISNVASLRVTHEVTDVGTALSMRVAFKDNRPQITLDELVTKESNMEHSLLVRQPAPSSAGQPGSQ